MCVVQPASQGRVLVSAQARKRYRFPFSLRAIKKLCGAKPRKPSFIAVSEAFHRDETRAL
jgi:hypothetical protein